MSVDRTASRASSRRARVREGCSLVGLLVSVVCLLVLFVIGMSAINKTVTGEGSAKAGTVHSMQDQIGLHAIHQSMTIHAADHDGRFVTPSGLTGNPADDTTASLFSVMIMRNYVTPEALISANEFSGYVDPVESYDYRCLSPRDGVYWDRGFVADLSRFSNVSYAHVPLFGERFERSWKSFGPRFPILGNRGPRDGVHDPSSYTYGRNGIWGGHIVFADGHVEFVETFTPSSVFYERDDRRREDNLFAVEDGPGGRDAILSFTKTMTPDGPELQFD